VAHEDGVSGRRARLRVLRVGIADAPRLVCIRVGERIVPAHPFPNAKQLVLLNWRHSHTDLITTMGSAFK
jgi:hypothetical protein